jgi:hypothetical protein
MNRHFPPPPRTLAALALLALAAFITITGRAPC